MIGISTPLRVVAYRYLRSNLPTEFQPSASWLVVTRWLSAVEL